MGDEADRLRDLAEDESSQFQKQIKTCDFCLQGGFVWGKTEVGYRLFTPEGEMHTCASKIKGGSEGAGDSEARTKAKNTSQKLAERSDPDYLSVVVCLSRGYGGDSTRLVRGFSHPNDAQTFIQGLNQEIGDVRARFESMQQQMRLELSNLENKTKILDIDAAFKEEFGCAPERWHPAHDHKAQPLAPGSTRYVAHTVPCGFQPIEKKEILDDVPF